MTKPFATLNAGTPSFSVERKMRTFYVRAIVEKIEKFLTLTSDTLSTDSSLHNRVSKILRLNAGFMLKLTVLFL